VVWVPVVVPAVVVVVVWVLGVAEEVMA